MRRLAYIAFLTVVMLSAYLLGNSAQAPPPTKAAVSAGRGDFETGDFSEFSGGANLVNGSLSVTTENAYTGTHSAKATVQANVNAYARTLRDDISWVNGDDVWYGEALYLPPGFKAAERGVAVLR